MMNQAVLVVDDDPQMRQLMQWALEDEGLAVQTAADGREAIERIMASPPGVVVLDMTLPDVDGFGVAERLHAVHADRVPIVMVTADGSAAEKARRIGAYAFLRKPFEMKSLLENVRSALAARR
jgi:two-component system C4-dicarboxylate transport response regulator DctD